MFSLRHATKTFAGKPALDAVDLEVAAGRTTVLIGPSGCGKSTLLRLLIGLVAADAGAVLFDGTPVDPRTAPALRHRMGYVIQDGGLFPHLTARRNVVLMAEQTGWDRARIDARVATLAELVHLPAEALGRYPAELSGGQRQRIGLMRALMLDPEVLLLDEPLGALDPIVRFELQGDLRDIFRALGKTVVLVTHDLAEAGYFADTIVLMRDGRIVQQGTLADFVEAPADPFVERFVTARRRLAEVMTPT